MRTLLILIPALALTACDDWTKPQFNHQIGPVTGGFARMNCDCTWFNLRAEKEVHQFRIDCERSDAEEFFTMSFPDPPRPNERFPMWAELQISGAINETQGRAIVEMGGASIKDPRGEPFTFYFRPFFVHSAHLDATGDNFCEFFDPDTCYSLEESTMMDSAFWCQDMHASANNGESE